MNKYNHLKIEKKWQNYWINKKTFKTTEDDTKDFFYVLDMFPYPSGSGLHVGHAAGYTITDIIARYKRMNNFNVLHPIGWDAFGLPAEEYAIKTKNHPQIFTDQNIQTFRQQLQLLGFSYDWDKEISTTDPQYIKWTQWIVQQLYQKDLAVLKEVKVNWCPHLSTVLANEQVIKKEDGSLVSERGEHFVIKKPMVQWVLKITDYANQLIDNLANLDWLKSTKIMQQNWIKDPKTQKLKMHDWTFSRQRYWGEPFPFQKKAGKIALIPEEKLPLLLPQLSDFKSKNGQPALANSKEWVANHYDLNTMPGSAGSSWYFLAYILKNENGYLALNSPEAKRKLNKWMPVNLYVGGTEHTVGHLLFARFWNRFLAEQGILNIAEPFQKLIHQGIILGNDNKKMSKSKGNMVNPDDIIKNYGTDSLRTYLMFMGSYDEKKTWNAQGVKAIKKWLAKIWRLFNGELKIVAYSDQKLLIKQHKLIIAVTNCYEQYKFNNAIAHLMTFINYIFKTKMITKEASKVFIQLLNPIAPHITQELWTLLKYDDNINYHPWPLANKSLLVEVSKNLIIQVNGKFKTKLKVNFKTSPEVLKKIALKNNKICKFIGEKKIIKIIVLDNLINIFNFHFFLPQY